MTYLFPLYRLHDWASSLLATHFLLIKRTLLVVAHLALFGLLFPELRRNFGSAAELMLLGVLFLSPVSKILRTRILLQLMALRREMGIMMGYLATVHGLRYFIDPDWAGSITALFQETGLSGESIPYFLGLVAYGITLPLLLTSNVWAQRSLGGINWKRLHRMVYVVLPLVLIHHFSIQRGISPLALIQAALITFAYISLKLLAWQNFLPPLKRGIDAVAKSYRDYNLSRQSQETKTL